MNNVERLQIAVFYGVMHIYVRRRGSRDCQVAIVAFEERSGCMTAGQNLIKLPKCS